MTNEVCSRSYLNRFILARLAKGVEKGFGAEILTGLILLIWMSTSLTWAAKETSQTEIEPWPQMQVAENPAFEEAKQLLLKRKWENAVIVLRSVLKKDPTFTPAILGLSQALAYTSRREEALSTLGQAASREKGPRHVALASRIRVLSRLFMTNSTFQIYQDGLNLLAAKKFGPARERFEKALEIEPENVEILTRLAQCLVLENDVDSATEKLRFAKKLNPYEPEVRLWLGRSMTRRGEFSEALEELKNAVQGLKGSETAPIWYSEALMMANQKAEALRVLEEDVKTQPTHLMSLLKLSRLRLQSQVSQLLPVIKRDLTQGAQKTAQYGAAEQPRFESELGVDQRMPGSELKGEFERLLKEADEV